MNYLLLHKTLGWSGLSYDEAESESVWQYLFFIFFRY